MKLIDADELMTKVMKIKYLRELKAQALVDECNEVDAIPIDYIDQVIDEYEHMIEHYLYDDDEDLKEYLCYRNCLNNLKRRWKRDRQKLRI